MFRESLKSPPKIPDKFHSIHNINLKRLECQRVPSFEKLSFIGAPFECIHPSGQFSLDKFARNLPDDLHHASDAYWRLFVSRMTHIL